MRNSFASNYYGKIETLLSINITGHSKERTFLNYIGTHQNKDALADVYATGRSYLVKTISLERIILKPDFIFNSI
jgi:hypothetical protein